MIMASTDHMKRLQIVPSTLRRPLLCFSRCAAWNVLSAGTRGGVRMGSMGAWEPCLASIYTGQVTGKPALVARASRNCVLGKLSSLNAYILFLSSNTGAILANILKSLHFFHVWAIITAINIVFEMFFHIYFH